MKNIMIFAILAMCYSCAQKEGGIKVKNNDSSAFTGTENVEFTDSCILISEKNEIELKGTYKNFELNFECKTDEGTIGAILFHCKNGSIGTGYEVFINNNIDPSEWRKTGGLTGIRNFGKRTVDNNEWFPIKITAVGKQIKTYSNNVSIVDYTEPEIPYREAHYKQCILSEGSFIFLCNSGNPLKIRNIIIKQLPNDTVANSHAQSEQNDEILKLHQRNFPTIDYHIHAKGGLSPEDAGRISRSLGITYSVTPNCGLDFPIKNDKELIQWLAENKHHPFLMPMQAEGREWPSMFSHEAISQFDWVFTDALTWSDSKGRRLRLWIPDDTFVDDEQQFMEELTGVTCKIIETEPIQVLANPTFLPDVLVREYDRLWTEERMLRIINAAVKHNIALELNNQNRIPSFRFIELAKQKGAKFTFGTNNYGSKQLKKMEYLIEAIDKCGLTASDMYIPTSKNF